MSVSSSLTPSNLALNGEAKGFLRLEDPASTTSALQISSNSDSPVPLRLTGIADGANPNDAVNKTQLSAVNLNAQQALLNAATAQADVDALEVAVAAITSGITWVNSVELAVVRSVGTGTNDSAANDDLFTAQAVSNLLSFNLIDGVTFDYSLLPNTRVAVMISNGSQYNGVWIRNTNDYDPSLAFTALFDRAADFVSPLTVADVSGKAFIVKRGTTYGDTAWLQSADIGGVIPVGAATDLLTFVQISQQAITAGVNIDLVNREIHLEPAITLAGTGSDSNTITVTKGNISVDDGNIVVAAGGTVEAPLFTCVSDERKKDIIGHVTDASDAVNRIEPIYYTMKTDIKKRKRCGVSAQQVREVTPDAVIEDKDGFLSVDYHYFTGLLLAHNKQLGKAVDELWAEVSEIKRQRS
jgi:hypothetical protein